MRCEVATSTHAWFNVISFSFNMAEMLSSCFVLFFKIVPVSMFVVYA